MSKERDHDIVCPYCGWNYKIPITTIENASTTIVVKGPLDTVQGIASRLKLVLGDHRRTDANALFDVRCSQCKNVFLYNARTRETET